MNYIVQKVNTIYVGQYAEKKEIIENIAFYHDLEKALQRARKENGWEKYNYTEAHIDLVKRKIAAEGKYVVDWDYRVVGFKFEDKKKRSK